MKIKQIPSPIPIGNEKRDVTEEVLQLFTSGIDIVIIEYPKGIVIKEGKRCHVFIRDYCWSSFSHELWQITNWIWIKPIDQRLTNCLYSPYNYKRTLESIIKSFPNIKFEILGD